MRFFAHKLALIDIVQIAQSLTGYREHLELKGLVTSIRYRQINRTTIEIPFCTVFVIALVSL